MPSRGDTIDKAIELKDGTVGEQLQARLETLGPPLAGEADVVTRLRLKLREAIGVLEQIACGNVGRNAASQLKAIEILLRYSQPLPKQTVAVEGSVGIEIIDPYAEEHTEGQVVEVPVVPLLPPPPAAAPVAPVVRKRKAKQEPKP